MNQRIPVPFSGEALSFYTKSERGLAGAAQWPRVDETYGGVNV